MLREDPITGEMTTKLREYEIDEILNSDLSAFDIAETYGISKRAALNMKEQQRNYQMLSGNAMELFSGLSLLGNSKTNTKVMKGSRSERNLQYLYSLPNASAYLAHHWCSVPELWAFIDEEKVSFPKSTAHFWDEIVKYRAEWNHYDNWIRLDKVSMLFTENTVKGKKILFDYLKEKRAYVIPDPDYFATVYNHWRNPSYYYISKSQLEDLLGMEKPKKEYDPSFVKTIKNSLKYASVGVVSFENKLSISDIIKIANQP